MKRNTFYFIVLAFALFILSHNVKSQEKISWLDDHTSDIIAGSYTYSYNFYTLDKDCKIKIEEKKINKKGSETIQTSIFYLSDISPSSLSFKSSGKMLTVSMETTQSQKFISQYVGDEFQGYSNEISLYTDAVDKARSLINAFLSHIETCKDNERTWESREEAFEWLTNNISESEKSGTHYKQSFIKGKKSYLAILETESTDSKGQQKANDYTIDLSDITPNEIKLVVSGKSLKIYLPVSYKKNFIQSRTNDKDISYTRAINIHVDDIELARDQISALKYLVSNTEVKREEYSNYNNAMSFIAENLKDITVGSNTFSQSLTFEDSPSGLVNYKSIKTDSKGISKEQSLQFYLCDIKPEVTLNVSTSTAEISIITIDKAKYIKQTLDGNLMSYISSVKIYVDDIDAARNIINALEYSLKYSISGIQT